MEWLAYFANTLDLASRTVVGVTRVESSRALLERYAEAFHVSGVKVPVLAVDPRRREDIENLVLTGLALGETPLWRRRVAEAVAV